MSKKLSKTEAQKKIENFFKNIKDKKPKEIKNIKRVAMSHNIPLKEKRKLFCKKCFTPYSGKEKIRIKDGKKTIVCESCGEKGRWKLSV